MKRRKSILTTVSTAMLLIFGCGYVDATSWRINNNANRHAHFTDFNAAMSSSDVKDGDTLYLDPGCTLTSTQTVSKRVTIIGTGYSLPAGTHAVAAVNAKLYLKAEGIKVESVAVTATSDMTWYIQAANVTIERCHNHFISIEAQNATIRQCRGFHYFGKGKTSMASAYCTIENCMLGTTSAINIYDLYMATIRNNYLWTESKNANGLLNNLGNSQIANNIIVAINQPNVMFNASNLTGCIVLNNILTCSEGTYPAYPDNICLGSATTEDVFATRLVTRTISDVMFAAVGDIEQAKDGDIGPFAGLHPYVLSGYPLGMPHFVSSSANTLAVDGKVSFSNEVKIQKQ